jgi:hypothetical protein
VEVLQARKELSFLVDIDLAVDHYILTPSLNFPPAFKISTSFAYKGSWVHWLEISPIRIISCLAVSPARPKRITISEIGAEIGATFYDDGSKFVLVH